MKVDGSSRVPVNSDCSASHLQMFSIAARKGGESETLIESFSSNGNMRELTFPPSDSSSSGLVNHQSSSSLLP